MKSKCNQPSPTAAGLLHGMMAPAAMTGAAIDAGKKSCGVGSYSLAYVSTACACSYDKTVLHAGKTTTLTSGTTLLQTKGVPTVTITSTKYKSTHAVTTTATHDYCYPPANSTCLNPGDCDQYFYNFICGSENTYLCTCAYDVSSGYDSSVFVYHKLVLVFFGASYHPY